MTHRAGFSSYHIAIFCVISYRIIFLRAVSCQHYKIGCQSFTLLDYADDVGLLAELLHILTRGLGVMSEEASLLGLQVNWAKTRIQHIGHSDSVPQVLVPAR